MLIAVGARSDGTKYIAIGLDPDTLLRLIQGKLPLRVDLRAFPPLDEGGPPVLYVTVAESDEELKAKMTEQGLMKEDTPIGGPGAPRPGWKLN